MGFWIMLIAFILGLGLLISGFSPNKQKSHFKRDVNKLSAVTGLVLIGFAVYLDWPK